MQKWMQLRNDSFSLFPVARCLRLFASSTVAFVCLLLACSGVSAQIAVSGDTDPAASFWINGGNSNTTGTIGNTNTGTLLVEASSNLSLRGGYLGFSSGSIGTANVTGAGSIWNNFGGLFVGNSGTGTLDVEAGGYVSSNYSDLGVLSGSNGTVTVTGAGSQWINRGELIVGKSGTGALNVEDGGVVTPGSGRSTTVFLGSESGSKGTVIVTGTGSQWDASTLIVGNSGTGTFNLEDGGTVTSRTSALGNRSGSNGTVTVTGAGSQWNNSFSLIVGSDGTGTLNVKAGGVLNNDYFSVLGASSRSNGTVTVTGAGSQWNNSYTLEVGRSGTGMLNVEAGGSVSSSDGYLGERSGSNGTVTVDGAESQWDVRSELRVGGSGTGQLNVRDGGVVSSGLGRLGEDAGSIGTVTVTGVGSQFNNRNSLRVGGSGSGTLNIGVGASVSSGGVFVAAFGGSTGRVNLNGTLSTNQLLEGSGNGSVFLNRGTLQLTSDQANLFEGFEAGNVTLSAGGGTIDTQAFTVASELSLRGEGGLTKQGAGTLTLSSANNFSGATTVAAGTLNVTGSLASTVVNVDAGAKLQVDGASLVNSSAVTLNGSGNLTLSGNETIGSLAGAGSSAVTMGANSLTTGGNNSSSSFSGTISGNGALNKWGSGTFTLTGTNTYSGATNIQAGALLVNGNNNGTGAVTAQSGTTLGGSGLIAGAVTVRNGGTLTPGNSSGILTVGSLNLEAGSATNLEVNGLTPGTEDDQIQVAGNAALGGELNLAFAGADPVNGQSYTFIEADSITGDFDNVILDFDKAIVFETLITNAYVFNIIGIETDFASFAFSNAELTSIAQLIDDNFTDPGILPTINALNLLDEAALESAFEQINPDELTALSGMSFANARNAVFRLGNRLREVRKGTSGFSTAGFNLYDTNGQHIPQSLIAGSEIPAGTQSQPLGDASDSPLSYFVSGSATWLDLDDDSKGPGFEDDSFGVLFGVDYRIASDLSLGLYGGYDYSDTDFGGDGGSADLDTYRLGISGTWWTPIDEGRRDATQILYTEAYLGAAYHEYDIERNSFGGNAKGDTDAHEFDAGFAVGYEIERSKWTFTTELSLDYIKLWLDGYTETGSHSPLVVKDERSDSLYSTLSFRTDYQLSFAEIDLLPYAQLGWRHQYLDTSESISARFAGSAAGNFTVDGATTSRDSVIGSLGISALLGEGLTAQLGYYGEHNSDLEIHSLNASFNFSF